LIKFVPVNLEAFPRTIDDPDGGYDKWERDCVDVIAIEGEDDAQVAYYGDHTWALIILSNGTRVFINPSKDSEQNLTDIDAVLHMLQARTSYCVAVGRYCNHGVGPV